jgi:phosphoribosylformimino-5-aminoimidazole carboxamide ribotide isomerase
VDVDVIGVLDLRHGVAVHAVAGDRQHYAPARMTAVQHVAPGDAVAIAGAYVALGLTQIYVADLDAIVDRAPQRPLVRSISGVGAPLWVDAGIRSADEAHAALENGAGRLVIGLETLPSWETFDSLCREVGSERTAFSLDLRHGTPLAGSVEIAVQRPESLVVRAVDAGATAVIVLDLARVGTGTGLDLGLLARVRAAAPGITLIAGGGVRGRDDLVRLRDSGCDAALVATALLNGQLTADIIRAFRTLPMPFAL